MAKWLAILAVALAPAAADAQPRADGFGDMQSKLRVGQEAIVVDRAGDEIEGTVLEVSPSALLLRVPGCLEPRRFTADGVRKVVKAQNLWDGALKGAAVGGVATMLMLNFNDYSIGQYPEIILVGAGYGAGIGVGIDALWRAKVVYRAPNVTRRIALSPVVGGGRRGVRAAITF